MAKRRSTIPVAHADVLIAFTNEQWEEIEDAYGRPLNAEMRQQITTVTTRYLKYCGFERTAAPEEMAREHIECVRRGADDLERMLGREPAELHRVYPPVADAAAGTDATQRDATGDAAAHQRAALAEERRLAELKAELSRQQQQSAHSYADSLIRRHLVPSPQWAVDSQRHVRPNLMSHIANVIDAQLDSFDAQCNRQRLARDKLRHLQSALKSLVVACDCALNDLSAAEGHHAWGWWIVEGHHGKAWGWWIQQLTRLAKEHGLPAGVSPEVDKDGRPLPFVSLVEELESHLPADARPRERSPAALAMAILRARNT
jgi:hypothetical protein